jgi:hypothetical protein
MIAKCLEKLPEKRYANGTELQEVIAESSIKEIRVEVVKEIAATVVPPAPIVVQRPNLQPQPGMMQISQSVFAGLMILLIGFMAYSAYSLFRPVPRAVPVATVLPDTARINDSFRRAEQQRIIDYRNKKRERDSVTQSTIGDIVNKENGKTDSTKTDSTGN